MAGVRDSEKTAKIGQRIPIGLREEEGEQNTPAKVQLVLCPSKQSRGELC